MIDFLIVGNGLAANVLALNLRSQGLSYHIVGDPQLSNCSRIAAGLWNPIVFKRMTKSWKVDEFLPELKQFYTSAEETLDAKFYTEREILKPFFSQEEKDHWIKKSGSDLHAYLSNELHEPDAALKNLIVPSTYGIVKQCGNIDMKVFLDACTHFHTTNLCFTNETFDHTLLVLKEDHVQYKNISAKNSIFCEGYLVKNNPLFNWIPLNPVKGEVLEIESKEIDLNSNVFNRNGFVFKLNGSRLKVGATYDWADLSENTSEKGLTELKDKLAQITTATYTITAHKAGVRPSSIDRRPIIGAHPIHKNLFVFNGLGTKGVMIAPYFAKNFVNFYLKKEVLDTEVSIERFYSKYSA
jgi:glycine oxidase